MHEFAEALINFDNIIIIDTYAAREINTFNIYEEDLIKEINILGKNAVHISDHDEVIKLLKENVQKNDIVLTLGAGNVTKIAEKLKNL